MRHMFRRATVMESRTLYPIATLSWPLFARQMGVLMWDLVRSGGWRLNGKRSRCFDIWQAIRWPKITLACGRIIIDPYLGVSWFCEFWCQDIDVLEHGEQRSWRIPKRMRNATQLGRLLSRSHKPYCTWKSWWPGTKCIYEISCDLWVNFKGAISNKSYGLYFLWNFILDECHNTSLLLFWVGLWLVAIRHLAYTWTNAC